MSSGSARRKANRIAVIAAMVAGTALPASAEMKPTLTFGGTTGLIDMPSGESQSDGTLSVVTAHFGPISRTTLSFQITPRLSGSFRYTGIRKWDDVLPSPLATNYDRSFDLRYQLFDEGRYMPGVVIGLQDVIGTGLMSGEYLAATKTLGKSVKVTAGLGWGRYGSYGSIGATGTRPAFDTGVGGTVRTGQWFRGDFAPFAGVEWQVNDKLGLKVEYSSDAYALESGSRKTFDRKSPYNFGVEYQVKPNLRVGAYYLYGSEVGLSAQIVLDPKVRPTGGMLTAGALPVKDRPSRAANAAAWSPLWITEESGKASMRSSLAKTLRRDGITLEAITFGLDRVEVRIRTPNGENSAQVIGRTARAMAATMPATVETFDIVPLERGVAVSKVVIRRSDLEDLEFAGAQDALIRQRAQILAVSNGLPPDALRTEGLYPKFNWGLAPYARTSLFDPENPLRIDVGLQLSASYAIAPGLLLSGSIGKKLTGNLGDSTRVSNSVLPHVRSDSNIYDREGDPSLNTLTLAWYGKPAPNLYSRVTVGYLERMFGGVSTELLWKKVDSRFALGAELNYVKQRDFDQLLGFQDYSVLTGHVSGYLDLGKGYSAQLDVGRYLAGDYGATLAIDREFANGWKVGAFATLTDVPFEDFGEGSFDKGIRLSIPFAWALGRPTEKAYNATIRPILRDGGARLSVDGRLYDTVRGYHETQLDAQWGRFWR